MDEVLKNLMLLHRSILTVHGIVEGHIGRMTEEEYREFVDGLMAALNYVEICIKRLGYRPDFKTNKFEKI